MPVSSLGASVVSVVVASTTMSHSLNPPPPLPKELAARVSPDAIYSYVTTLVSFGTRNTLSATDDPACGIGAARTYIRDTLRDFASVMPRGAYGAGGEMVVSFESFIQPPTPNGRIPEPTELVNVVAIIPGTLSPERRYYVVGHYDSRNSDGLDRIGDAPGANDDASGTAVVMELARIIAEHGPLESTVVFLATAGEEQGLLGAKYHAAQAAARGEKILGVLNNDMVGDPSAPDGVPPTPGARHLVRVFSEGIPRSAADARALAEVRALSAESDSPSRQLARYIAEIGNLYDLPVKPKLVFRPDRFLRGGDHSAFNEAGFPAVRFTELDENYSRQHQNVTEKDGKPYGDVPEYVDKAYLADVARLNLAAIVSLANAPSPPPRARLLVKELTHTCTIRWDPSPEPDVAGYEIVWRDTTDPMWIHAKDVGNVTEYTLDMNKDDWFFGVRAYDKDGYRSPVSFPAAAQE